MFKWIYLLLLVSSVGFVFWKGQIEERIVAATLVVGSLLTFIIFDLSSQDWLRPNFLLIANETVVTAIIVCIAFRSARFWPLPIAAFQIIALVTPMAALFGENLASHALGITQGMWAYLQLIILTIATIRGPRTANATPPK